MASCKRLGHKFLAAAGMRRVRCRSRGLFNHLIGDGENAPRDVKPERLCGLEVDDELELSRLLDRDIGRLRPTQNLVDHLGGTPEQVRKVGAIRHQAARGGPAATRAYRRQPPGRGQSVKRLVLM